MSTTATGLRLGAIALGLVLSLVAQSDRGSIVGIVTDSTGAVVPRVTVVATNTATNNSRETLSNDSGKYVLLELPVGVYNLTLKEFRGKFHRVHIDTTGELK
jgi:hypothetical protein